jgi:hypothetical protein
MYRLLSDCLHWVKFRSLSAGFGSPRYLEGGDILTVSRHLSNVPIAHLCAAAKQATTRHFVGAGKRRRTAPGFSITRLLFRGYHPDAAQLALLNEFNKSNVGPVEFIVPHWGASLSGFFTQPLIHRQSLLQNWSPFFRQIF